MLYVKSNKEMYWNCKLIEFNNIDPMYSGWVCSTGLTSLAEAVFDMLNLSFWDTYEIAINIIEDQVDGLFSNYDRLTLHYYNTFFKPMNSCLLAWMLFCQNGFLDLDNRKYSYIVTNNLLYDWFNEAVK